MHMVQMVKNYVIMLLVLFVPGTLMAQNSLGFGDNGEIIYDTENGTASVFVGGNEVVSNAYAEALNGTSALNTKTYTTRTITFSDINDGFGSGTKMTVLLTADGLPEMQQVFYAYEGRNYFLTELLISGAEVSSNYMAPLVSEKVNIGETGDNRVLFVPFDNDTFIRYQSKPMDEELTNTSSEVTAIYENNSRVGLVVGSVEHTDWKTGVKTTGTGNVLSEFKVWGGYTDEAVTRDAIPHGSLSGTTIKSPKIFVGFFSDWRTGLDEYGKANAIAEPRYIFNWEEPTPFGWNSWGAVQTSLNLDKAKAVADFFTYQVPGFRNNETAYIDLDSYWDNMISGGLEGDFSQLVEFVQYCKARGLKPGIYWAPFVDWGKSERKVEGSSYNYSEVWTKVNGNYHDLDGTRAMDPTHPATQKRIDLVIDKFIACGFEMIKIDFIGHASIEADSFYDPTVKTGMQAFRKGMEYLIDRLDDKMLVYAAISPNLATGRYVHMRRIACDAYSDINATEYTLNSTTYGWWQTYIYNFIDADHMVFDTKTLGENRARFTSGVINGTLITGDDFSETGQWTERAKLLLSKQEILDIARNGEAFRPLEGNSEKGASEVFVNKIGEDYFAAVINYGEAKSYELQLDRMGIPFDVYRAKELFNGNSSTVEGPSLSFDLGSKDAVIYKFTQQVINAVDTDIAADTAILYPNPTSDLLKIKSEKGIQSLKVLTLNGKVIYSEENISNNEFSIDMSRFKSGAYIIRLVDQESSTNLYKVIKE